MRVYVLFKADAHKRGAPVSLTTFELVQVQAHAPLTFNLEQVQA